MTEREVLNRTVKILKKRIDLVKNRILTLEMDDTVGHDQEWFSKVRKEKNRHTYLCDILEGMINEGWGTAK